MWKEIEKLLDKSFFGNKVLDYFIFLGLLLLLLIVTIIIHLIVRKKLKKLTLKQVDVKRPIIAQSAYRYLIPLAYFGAFYLSLQNLILSVAVTKIVEVIGIGILLFVLVRFTTNLVKFGFNRLIERTDDRVAKLRQLRGFIPAINIGVWVIAILFMMDNIGFDLNTIAAGLGIGGIAVALAAQAILKDLFSYISILFDKPFELGDFLVVGEHMGVVEKIGIKSTRVRSLGGELLVIANSDITDSRIKNYKRMFERRVLFSFGVTYDTPVSVLKIIPSILQEIISECSEVRFDRAHFQSFGDSSLDFEVVYYVLSPDYNIYMDIQQQINVKLMEHFQALNVEFAFPTRTIYMASEKS